MKNWKNYLSVGSLFYKGGHCSTIEKWPLGSTFHGVTYKRSNTGSNVILKPRIFTLLTALISAPALFRQIADEYASSEMQAASFSFTVLQSSSWSLQLLCQRTVLLPQPVPVICGHPINYRRGPSCPLKPSISGRRCLVTCNLVQLPAAVSVDSGGHHFKLTICTLPCKFLTTENKALITAVKVPNPVRHWTYSKHNQWKDRLKYLVKCKCKVRTLGTTYFLNVVIDFSPVFL